MGGWVWSRLGKWAVLSVAMMTAQQAWAQSAPPSTADAPPPPSPPPRRAAIGRQVVVTTAQGEIAGKIVDVNDTLVAIQKDSGERFILARAAIKSVRERVAEPSPELAPVEPPRTTSVFRPLDPFHVWLVLGSGVGWLTSQAATTQGLGQVSPILHLGVMPEIFDLVTTACTLDLVFPSDNGGFSQEVVDQYGNISTASSSTSITIVGLAAGLRTPVLGISEWRGRGGGKAWSGAFGYVRGGRAWISGGRSIGDCSDCMSANLTLAGGPFLDAGAHIQLEVGDVVGMSFFTGYRQYFGASSMVGEVQLGLGLSFF